jgi:hypothetical protein
MGKNGEAVTGKIDANYNRFIISAALLLFLTAVAKIWSAFGHAKLLEEIDPITNITFRNLLLMVAIAELAVAGVCFFGKSKTLALGLIAALATNFFVYRLALWKVGWTKPCSCLGNFAQALHLPPELTDNVMKVTLLYLLIGSYGILFFRWWYGRISAKCAVGSPETIG